MDKECVIVAVSKHATSTAACQRLDEWGFRRGRADGGFYPYYGGLTMPDIVVIDLAALDPNQLSPRLCKLRENHHLTLLCATSQDQYMVRRMIKSHPVKHLQQTLSS